MRSLKLITPKLPTRIDMTCSLTGEAAPVMEGLRGVRLDDRLSLASLLLNAYRGTIDSEEETIEEAVAEIQRTEAGEYGPYMPAESRLIECNSEVVCAVLLTYWKERPLVAFAMTLPQYKRQGLARACILHSMSALFASGHRQLSLVVTVKNEPAMHLYRQLGFREGR